MKPRIYRGSLFVAPVVGLLIWATLPVAGQSGTKNGEWTTYGADLGNTRYAPLDQVNGENFSKLEVAWRFKTDSLGPRPEYQFESTPLMVKGKRLLHGRDTARRRRARCRHGRAAVDAQRERGRARRGSARQLSGRGLAYWTDGREERIIYVTPGYRMIALDARNGMPIASFGKNGVVDLKLEDDQTMDLITGEVGYHSAPAVAGNTVIVGAAHLSGSVPRSRDERERLRPRVRRQDGQAAVDLPHDSAAGRVRERHLAERLVVATPATPGSWGQISVDEELGMAYLPIELPTGDYFGGHRPGNNLFGESIVAVDLKNGQRKWHFQLEHHGIWDHDIPCAPILVDFMVNGRLIKGARAADEAGDALRVRSRERKADLADRRASC